MTAFVTAEAAGATVLGEALGAACLTDEGALVQHLARQAHCDEPARQRITARALRLVQAVREDAARSGGLDAFLQTYGLDSQEGVLLLCLAEALLRIPDSGTADALIADRIGRGDWRAHLDDGATLFVNASTWGLLLTGALLSPDAGRARRPLGWLRELVTRLGEPVVRAALRQAMQILGEQFVFGADLDGALARSRAKAAGECHTFDMLGEAALGATDARRHLQDYRDAIAAIGRQREAAGPGPVDSVSVKLSALHPRYELAQRTRVLQELLPLLQTLLLQASQAGVPLTIDAEECERLELSLQLFAHLLEHPAAGHPGALGLAVQAYQKRAPVVIDWLAGLARARGRRIGVRLVKGAYWDSEIKRAQQAGLADYPVYTRKLHTDVAYLACARRLHAHREWIGGQFATHNAHTVAWIAELYAGEAVEFQRLHGMGVALYRAVLEGAADVRASVRIYAPVGPHAELLPYLVRRLLENGANTSFVHRAADRRLDPHEVVRDPTLQPDLGVAAELPRPPQLYGAARRNSAGVNLFDLRQWQSLQYECRAAAAEPWLAQAVVDGQARSGALRPSFDPAALERRIGQWCPASPADVERAAESAAAAGPQWDRLGGEARALILERAADLFEAARGPLLARCVREGGRTLMDSLGEWREAVDFLRYYAQQARALFAGEQPLPGPDGERNALRLQARGVFACISPWNFPLALFTGQVAAALAAGNSVLAKPAEQTPLTAALACELLHAAGVPPEVLQFLPGDGVVGAQLCRDLRVDGVAFTGSTQTAQTIARLLAARDGPIATLIAETGGVNALIADSSALLAQLVPDAIASAFNSAGQRCSAARVLFAQTEICAPLLEALAGAMDELRLGDPGLLATDVGPLIDADALAALRAHEARLAALGAIVHRAPSAALNGHFFAPLLARLERLTQLPEEVFGPVLHVIPWQAAELERVVADINASGHGLTLGIHTRIESRAEWIARAARVGNVYVNRNMIGAVVGVQPFGGRGRSGTGPKAGGPQTLQRYATEQCVAVNSAAIGGNAALLRRG